MTFYSMFPSMIYKARIDPKSYDKKAIIDTAVKNYEIDPTKNNWDNTCDLHHYYYAMDEAPSEIKSLTQSYKTVINDYMSSISKNANAFKYRWKMVNFAVNTKYMAAHDHFYKMKGWQSAFSCCHYISYNWRYHSPTKFINPLVIGQYSSTTQDIANLLDKGDINNSSYFGEYSLDVKEDDMIIFPSYLKHIVANGIKQKTDIPRILGVANIDIGIGD